MNQNSNKQIDENSNILNKTNNKESSDNNQRNQKISNLNNLKYIFPFLSESTTNKNQNEYNNELNKIMSEIISSNSTQYLQGKANIIDKLITKHGKIKAQDIPNLKKLKFTIPQNFGMLNDFGYHLPNLEELNLEGSKIISISEIGTSFFNLKILNVSSCGLKDLTGIICFKQLEELYAKNNEIDDLIDLEMCNELRILNIENNKIDNEDNFFFLNSCEKLECVYIGNNPITKKLKSNNINILDSKIKLIFN